MVTELVKSENSYQTAFRSVRELSQTVPWLELVRSSAMDRFEQLGFPSVREEDWKYTNLAALAKENFVPATTSTESVDVSGFAYPETEGAHLVVVNGFLREDLSQISRAQRRLSQQRPDGSKHGVFAVRRVSVDSEERQSRKAAADNVRG
jgi:Fe-S cluster assembly protein SufD